jgi:hypothetical protein
MARSPYRGNQNITFPAVLRLTRYAGHKGRMPVRVECAPAFNYSLSIHATKIVSDQSSAPQEKGLFTSPPRSGHAAIKNGLVSIHVPCLRSELLPDHLEFGATCAANPHEVELKPFDLSWRGHNGPGIECEMEMKEGQAITYIFRIAPESAKKKDESHRASTRHPTKDIAEKLGMIIEKLVAAKSHLQPDRNPVIAPVRIFMLALAMCTTDHADV